VPGVTGLAVAATAAGVLVATAPARQVAQPAPPAVSASPQPTRTPTGAMPSPTASVPAPTRSPSVVAPSPTGGTDAAARLDRTLQGAGWRVRVPSTWTADPQPGRTSAVVVCMGPAEQPCLLKLAAGLDADTPPEPTVLGAGLLPEFGTACRRVGDASELTVGTHSAATLGWRCGQATYQQVLVREDLLVVVAHTSADPAVPEVVRALQVDTGYVRPWSERDCPDVSFAADSDAKATGLMATGVKCVEADALVRALEPRINVVSGPERVRLGAWSCKVSLWDQALPTALVSCSASGRRHVVFSLS
jgi:hypothetical protein